MIVKPYSPVTLETAFARLKFIIHAFAVLLENIDCVYSVEEKRLKNYNKVCVFQKLWLVSLTWPMVSS